jgi:hypothetical protein
MGDQIFIGPARPLLSDTIAQLIELGRRQTANEGGAAIDPALLGTANLDPAGAPSLPIGTFGTAAFESIILSWAMPALALVPFRSYEVYEGTTSGFAPDTGAFSNRIMATPQTVVSIPHITGSGPWYEKVCAVNSRGERSAFVSFGPFTMAQIASVDLGPGSVYAVNMAANAVDLASNVVTGQINTAKLADNAITQAKLQTSIIDNTRLVDGAVTAAKVAAGAVTNAKLAVDAIQANVIAAGAVIETKIGTDAISTRTIAAGAVTATEIAANTITAVQIAANTITAGQIATGAITAGKIAAGAVTAGTIAAEAVTAGTIAAGVVTATEIGAGAVTTDKLNAGAVVATSIAAGAITSDKIAANAITAGAIAAGAVTTAKLVAGAVTANELAAGAVTTAKLVAGAVTVDTIAAGAITVAKLAAGTLSASNITAGTIAAGISITSPVITGGTFQTGTTGKRIIIMPPNGVPAIYCYSGYSGELSPGSINTGINGTQVFLGIQVGTKNINDDPAGILLADNGSAYIGGTGGGLPSTAESIALGGNKFGCNSTTPVGKQDVGGALAGTATLGQALGKVNGLRTVLIQAGILSN